MNSDFATIVLVMIIVLILTVIINRTFLPREPEHRAQLWRRHVVFWCKVSAGALVLAIVLAFVVMFLAHRG